MISRVLDIGGRAALSSLMASCLVVQTLIKHSERTCEYEEINYPATDEILGDIEILSKSIGSDLKELKELL